MFSDFLTMETLLLIATGLAIVIIVFVTDILARRAIARYSKRLELEPHIERARRCADKNRVIKYDTDNVGCCV